MSKTNRESGFHARRDRQKAARVVAQHVISPRICITSLVNTPACHRCVRKETDSNKKSCRRITREDSSSKIPQTERGKTRKLRESDAQGWRKTSLPETIGSPNGLVQSPRHVASCFSFPGMGEQQLSRSQAPQPQHHLAQCKCQTSSVTGKNCKKSCETITSKTESMARKEASCNERCLNAHEGEKIYRAPLE